MAQEIPVSDVMTTEVVSFTDDERVQDAVKQLVDAGVDGGPVLNADGKVVGMLSTTDLIVRKARLHVPTIINLLGATIEMPGQKKHFDEDVEKALGASVGEVMGEEVVTVGPGDSVETAATLMHDKDVSRLPVIDNEDLVGIIARRDILKAIMQS